ncbi:hypothetical protein ACQJBY_053809 [Aegilops geniculata]
MSWVMLPEGRVKVRMRRRKDGHILTQKERCLYCFENPSRPKHLVVALGNLTYLMLPQFEPIVPGHCVILPLQHESVTRAVDISVWEEIHNLKRCSLKMFALQGQNVIFMETACAWPSKACTSTCVETKSRWHFCERTLGYCRIFRMAQLYLTIKWLSFRIPTPCCCYSTW